MLAYTRVHTLPIPLYNRIKYYSETYYSFDFDSVRARRVALQALPLGHPAALRVEQGDHALEDGAGAVLHGVGAVAHLEELFAVGAAGRDELGAGLDNRAHHAGAQATERHVDGFAVVACEIGGDVVWWLVSLSLSAGDLVMVVLC